MVKKMIRIGTSSVDCINLAQDTHQQLTLANKTMGFRIKKKRYGPCFVNS